MAVVAKQYTVDEQVRGLVALARHAGNAAAACRETEIPAETLRRWRDTAEYEQTRRTYQQTIEQELIAEAREVALLEMQVEREATALARERMTNGNTRPSELAQIAGNMAKAKSLNIDKVLAMTGRPQSIIETRDFSQIVEGLMATRLLVDLTQIPDAEVIEDVGAS